jgi:hypothetical protein
MSHEADPLALVLVLVDWVVFCLPPPDVLVAVVVVGIGDVGVGMETDVCGWAFAFPLVSVWPLESEPQPAVTASRPMSKRVSPARVSEVPPMARSSTR